MVTDLRAGADGRIVPSGCAVWHSRKPRFGPTMADVVVRPNRGGNAIMTTDTQTFVQGVHGVRYQVKDVARSVAFYLNHLGFKLSHQQLPAFASITLGDSQILLSGHKASGSRPMPDGQTQEPGGWNRIVLRVSNLPVFIETLRDAGLHFRNEMETGPGGSQIQLEDPDGNAIELFEPAR